MLPLLLGAELTYLQLHQAAKRSALGDLTDLAAT